MRLLLCSSFRCLAEKFLPEFFDMSKKHNCLFIGYADEEKDFYSESNTEFLNNLGFNVYYLDENYKFNDEIDMIYAKGGNVTQLLYYLKKYNQFDKVKDLVLKKNVLFAGQSAGAIVGGTETKWTLESEPYDIDLEKEFGKDGYMGFGFVNKLIFVHASRFRFPWTDEIEAAGRTKFRVKNDFFFRAYLNERKMNKGKDFIVLKDNEAYLENDGKGRIVRLNWSKYPILDEFRIF